MDVVLGVAVTGRVARLAMVGAADAQVYDQYALDLPDDAMTDLAETIVGTYRAVADSGNRVAATRICLPDAARAETLRETVLGAGVANVEVVSEADAQAGSSDADDEFATARGAAHTAEASGFPAGAATQMAPVVGDATQMAPASDDATQMGPAADATQMGPAAGDATEMAPTTDPAVVGPQLAYSQEEPGEYELPFDSLEEFVPELEDEEAYTSMIAPPPPRTLLMGSALGFVVVSFATLAASVAIAVRPVADVSAQPPPPAQAQAETVPGRFLPAVPHEPDPVALPVAVVSPAPEAPREMSVRTNRGPNRVVPQVPAPQVPVPAPAPAPVPNVPVVPVPVPIVPFPPFNPFPTAPTWTTTVTPTTTATTPTTTETVPTTTETVPTTTETVPTTTETVPTTTETVPTTPTPTTSAEPTIPYSPVTPAPEPPVTQAVPAYTPPADTPAPAPAPVVPEGPSSGSGGGYGSGSDSGYGSGSDSGSGGSVQAPETTVLESP